MFPELNLQMSEIFIGVLLSSRVFGKKLFVFFPFRVSLPKKEIFIFYGCNPTKDGLVGGVDLYSWQNTIIALQGLDGGSARYFLMNRDSNSWSEANLTGIPMKFALGEKQDTPSSF